jgi:membrane-bound lytic murein transglycosylase MltF
MIAGAWMRWASTALLLGALARPALAGPIPSTYDSTIREAASVYLPGWDWRWWKAQLYQESRLDPTARSPVGAEGLAQFMPGTAAEVWRALGYGAVDRRAAEPSIRAGAYYMARLRRSWRAERPEGDRRALAQASYNAGLGSLLAAQRACGGPALWPEIAACLPAVTGDHATETLTYVERIARWFRLLA